MSVLMGIQVGIQNKKFIPAACAQWGGIRHTGLFAAVIKAAVGSRMQASLLSCAFLCCAADAEACAMSLSCLYCLPVGEGGRT